MMINEIEKKLIRAQEGDYNAKIEIGESIEKALDGEFGMILRAIIEGIKNKELKESRTNYNENSSKVLGRLEGLEELTNLLMLYIVDKNVLKEDLKKNLEI